MSCSIRPSEIEPKKKKSLKDKIVENFYSDGGSSLGNIINFLSIALAIYLSFKCNNGFDFGGMLGALCCPQCYILYKYFTTINMCGAFDFITGKPTPPPSLFSALASASGACPPCPPCPGGMQPQMMQPQMMQPQMMQPQMMQPQVR